MTAAEVVARLELLANPRDAQFLQGYFRTGPGEYGAGDRFLGIRVPALRKLTRSLDPMSLPELARLLESEWHEARLLALLALVRRYQRDASARADIYQLYLAHTARINNWDLVDLSAPHIVGAHLEARSRRPLYRLARSRLLWERRIAMLATLRFIKAGDVADTLALAEVLLHDGHDLVHKAVGWMLREAWQRAPAETGAFVAAHCGTMPRTMLRYAIEKQPEPVRRRYLAGDPPLSRRSRA